MKRHLIFTNDQENYIVKENDIVIFSISMNDLNFNALNFYNGIYADKSTSIEIENKVDNNNKSVGSYIFNWLKKIINTIAEEVPDCEEESETTVLQKEGKTIYLFDIAVCAGDGFLIDDSIAREELTVKESLADYAVNISGDSMEPLYSSGDILLVQKAEELQDGDIGIFTVDSDTMCKKYTINGKTIKLLPLNDEYNEVVITKDTTCQIQGKVLGKYVEN